ncbi:MAG: hypothetical protein HZB25_08310 [Candidatus Eisenbacteria bacterium]|nr:hypothetical protein [Candidatus Eisenbacteria bacterium]
MRTSSCSLALAGLLLGLSGPQPARAAGLPAAERLTSNSEMLRRAVRGAVDSMVSVMPLGPRDVVVILPAAGQRPEWALENEIAELLQRRVARLSFHGALSDTAESPAPADSEAEEDSAASAARQAARRRLALDRRPLDPNASLLEYRVAGLNLGYTDLHKSRLFGPGEVDRLATVSLGLRLMAPDGRLLWSGHGRGALSDRVPQARLGEVEDRLFSITPPSVPDKSLSRLLEPAIVVGLVTGLVFLFYTNRN